MQHNYKNPIYEFSIDSRECAIDLKLNDLPCFSTFEKGGVAIDWYVNANFLSSGKHSYILSLVPYEDENFRNRESSETYLDSAKNPSPLVVYWIEDLRTNG